MAEHEDTFEEMINNRLTNRERINLININIDEEEYKNNSEIINTFNIVEKINEIMHEYIEELVNIGNFELNERESFNYALLGGGERYKLYKNSDESEFSYNIYYSFLNYELTIIINQKFKNNKEYMNIIKKIKKCKIYKKDILDNFKKDTGHFLITNNSLYDTEI